MRAGARLGARLPATAVAMVQSEAEKAQKQKEEKKFLERKKIEQAQILADAAADREYFNAIRSGVKAQQAEPPPKVRTHGYYYHYYHYH